MLVEGRSRLVWFFLDCDFTVEITVVSLVRMYGFDNRFSMNVEVVFRVGRRD